MNEELREKVIKGLESIVNDDWMWKKADYYAGICEDAHAMLKAQEPRVMTLEEIGNALKMPIWKETRRAHKDLYTGWVLAYDIQKGDGITGTRLGMCDPSGRVVWYRLDDYGRQWRCWTAKPTEEQREAVKWDEIQ